jgi:hypothetical protein
MDEPEQTSDFCPLKKLSEHCDKTGGQSPSQAFLESSDFDCCPMTVSFFAGPVEKNSFSIEQLAAAAVTKVEVFRSEFRSTTPVQSIIRYRGPPPRDRRHDRLKHRVLLI